MAARFRSGTEWPFRPGFFFAYIATALLGGSAFISFRENAVARSASLAFIAILIGAVGFLFTDGFGSLRPEPYIEISLGAINTERQEQSASIWIENRGSRDMYLVSRRSDARNSYVYSLDRQIGANSWSEIPPVSESDNSEAGTLANVRVIVPGDRMALNFILAPDDYRVQLVAGASNDIISKPFSIDLPITMNPAPEIEMSESAPEITIPAPEVPSTNPLTQDAPNTVVNDDLTEPLFPDTTPPPLDTPKLENTIELKGILTSPDGTPRFSLVLIETDGSSSRFMLSLGEDIWMGWLVTEFNPTRGTITIQKDDRLLILRRGDPIPLN